MKKSEKRILIEQTGANQMKEMLFKAKNRYESLSLPLRSSFWFMVCSFAIRAVSMITTPIFTRLLSKSEYGITGTFSSWQLILEIIVTLELGACAMLLYVRIDDKKKVVSALCGMELLVCGIWVVFSIIFRNWFSFVLGMSPVLSIALFVTIMTNQSIMLWMGYKRYAYEYRGSVIVTFLLSALSSVLGVLCVLFVSPTGESKILCTTVVTAVIGIYFYITIIRDSKIFFDKNIWLFAVSYGIPLIPHYLAQYILSSSDRLMINSMCGSEDVAMYSVAYSVGTLIKMFTSSINASFVPYQFESIKNKNYAGLRRRANQVLLIVGAMLIGIMLFSYEVVLIFGGRKYLDCVDIIIPICLGIYFSYMFELFARVQEYYLHKFTIVLASVMCALLNLVLNYIFIRLYGYKAAAYTTFVCYFVFCFVHYLFYRRVLRMDLKGEGIYNIRDIAWISFGVAAVAAAMAYICNILWLKYCIIVVAVLIGITFRKQLIAVIKEMRKQHDE